jgi:hypothetical protein
MFTAGTANRQVHKRRKANTNTGAQHLACSAWCFHTLVWLVRLQSRQHAFGTRTANIPPFGEMRDFILLRDNTTQALSIMRLNATISRSYNNSQSTDHYSAITRQKLYILVAYIDYMAKTRIKRGRGYMCMSGRTIGIVQGR